MESSLWTEDVQVLRQWLDLIDFAGGGSQTVSLAPALLDAASLFALPTCLSRAGAQCHCIVSCVSEPSKTLVPWPVASDCMQVPVLWWQVTEE